MTTRTNHNKLPILPFLCALCLSAIALATADALDGKKYKTNPNICNFSQKTRIDQKTNPNQTHFLRFWLLGSLSSWSFYKTKPNLAYP